MNKLFLFSLSICFLYSCSSKNIECNNESIKETLVEIYRDNLYEYLNDDKLSKLNFQMRLMLGNNINLSKEELVSSFLKNMNFNFEGIRTTNQLKELKKCECASTLIISYKQEYKDKYKDALNTYSKHNISFDIEKALNELKKTNKSISIIYDAQLTDDNVDIYVNTYIDEDLHNIFQTYIGQYYVLKTIEIKIGKNSKNNNETRVYSDNQGGTYKLHIDNNELIVTYRYLDFIEKNNGILENGKIIINDLPQNLNIPNDKYYILEGNVFKAYNPEKNDYDNYILNE